MATASHSDREAAWTHDDQAVATLGAIPAVDVRDGPVAPAPCHVGWRLWSAVAPLTRSS
jgi:hypothetical protein